MTLRGRLAVLTSVAVAVTIVVAAVALWILIRGAGRLLRRGALPDGLMFMEDRAGALAELHRVLIPGGRVVINTPGRIQPPFEAMEQAIVEHIGPELGTFVGAVFSMHDPSALAGLLATPPSPTSRRRRTPPDSRCPGPPSSCGTTSTSRPWARSWLRRPRRPRRPWNARSSRRGRPTSSKEPRRSTSRWPSPGAGAVEAVSSR